MTSDVYLWLTVNESSYCWPFRSRPMQEPCLLKAEFQEITTFAISVLGRNSIVNSFRNPSLTRTLEGYCIVFAQIWHGLMKLRLNNSCEEIISEIFEAKRLFLYAFFMCRHVSAVRRLVGAIPTRLHLMVGKLQCWACHASHTLVISQARRGLLICLTWLWMVNWNNSTCSSLS